MLELDDLQRRFRDGLLDEAQADSLPIRGGRFSPQQRLQIYRNNLFTSLCAALGDVYPVIERLVGTGFFRHAASAYVERHPPRSGNLHEFGQQFSRFLGELAAAAGHPYLPDVAALEWAWHEAFHAPDHANVSLEALAAVPARQQERLRFELHPSCRLRRSAFPVVSIWQANQADEPETVDLDAGGECAMVIRRGLEVRIERLGPGEHALLETLERERLAVACVAALKAHADLDLDHCQVRHVTGGTLVDFHLS